MRSVVQLRAYYHSGGRQLKPSCKCCPIRKWPATSKDVGIVDVGIISTNMKYALNMQQVSKTTLLPSAEANLPQISELLTRYSKHMSQEILTNSLLKSGNFLQF